MLSGREPTVAAMGYLRSVGGRDISDVPLQVPGVSSDHATISPIARTQHSAGAVGHRQRYISLYRQSYFSTLASPAKRRGVCPDTGHTPRNLPRCCEALANVPSVLARVRE